MVEKLANAKATKDLLGLATDISDFSGRLGSYTESKCIYSRQMDTCVLEMLYFTNQTRQLMSEAKGCFEDCSGAGANLDSCKRSCVTNARAKFTGVKEMTEQMVQVSKAEL